MEAFRPPGHRGACAHRVATAGVAWALGPADPSPGLVASVVSPSRTVSRPRLMRRTRRTDCTRAVDRGFRSERRSVRPLRPLGLATAHRTHRLPKPPERQEQPVPSIC